MSAAYYIVSEREVPGLDCFVDGKALAHVRAGVVDRVCRQAGVRPLSEFLSSDPDEDAAFFDEEGIDPPPGGFPPEEWFDAADGLRTVRGLLTRVVELAAVAERGVRGRCRERLEAVRGGTGRAEEGRRALALGV